MKILDFVWIQSHKFHMKALKLLMLASESAINQPYRFRGNQKSLNCKRKDRCVKIRLKIHIKNHFLCIEAINFAKHFLEVELAWKLILSQTFFHSQNGQKNHFKADFISFLSRTTCEHQTITGLSTCRVRASKSRLRKLAKALITYTNSFANYGRLKISFFSEHEEWQIQAWNLSTFRALSRPLLHPFHMQLTSYAATCDENCVRSFFRRRRQTQQRKKKKNVLANQIHWEFNCLQRITAQTREFHVSRLRSIYYLISYLLFIGKVCGIKRLFIKQKKKSLESCLRRFSHRRSDTYGTARR
jgi:hypothetical protein